MEMHRLTVEQFRAASKLPVVVVLDDVRSAYNVGSMFRTADAFRMEALWLCGITACPPSAEIHKTALGAEDSVAWRHFDRAEEAVEELHRRGYFVYSIEQVEGATKLQDLCLPPTGPMAPPQGYAIVLGNEVKGVRQTVVDRSDACLEIPQWGTKHSLNVSSAAAIVMWEFARRAAACPAPV